MKQNDHIIFGTEKGLVMSFVSSVVYLFFWCSWENVKKNYRLVKHVRVVHCEYGREYCCYSFIGPITVP